jgi:hypothetical protein
MPKFKCGGCGKEIPAEWCRIVDRTTYENFHVGCELPKHPTQPFVMKNDVLRFKSNKIIDWLFNNGHIDLNVILMMDFPIEDHRQLAQLLGYSISGYGDLSYVQNLDDERTTNVSLDDHLERVDALAEKWLKDRNIT